MVKRVSYYAPITLYCMIANYSRFNLRTHICDDSSAHAKRTIFKDYVFIILHTKELLS